MSKTDLQEQAFIWELCVFDFVANVCFYTPVQIFIKKIKLISFNHPKGPEFQKVLSKTPSLHGKQWSDTFNYCNRQEHKGDAENFTKKA